MLGWNVSVFRQADGGSSPASAESPKGARLAVWQTGVFGLRWVTELVAAGHAVDLGGNGYPNRYTARGRYLIPLIVSGPPDANAAWIHDPEDIISPAWAGKTVIDEEAINACRPDEWLLIVAWDES